MNKAIKDLTVNRWTTDGAGTVQDQIIYWREDAGLNADELDEFNNWLVKEGLDDWPAEPEGPSAVNPSHYDFGNVQVIDITRHMDFTLGNVVKYVTRAGRKGDKLEDLLKAQTYLTWAIEDAQK